MKKICLVIRWKKCEDKDYISAAEKQLKTKAAQSGWNLFMDSASVVGQISGAAAGNPAIGGVTTAFANFGKSAAQFGIDLHNLRKQVCSLSPWLHAISVADVSVTT